MDYVDASHFFKRTLHKGAAEFCDIFILPFHSGLKAVYVILSNFIPITAL